MKMKRLLAMLLAGTMILGGVMGCGNNNSDDGSKKDDSTKKDDSSKEDDNKGEGDEEMVTIKMVGRYEPKDDDEMVIEELNKLLKEKVNVQIELECVSGGEFDTRAQNIITSGEDCDLIWTTDWTNVLSTNVARGAFMPLNDLLETEAGQAIVDVFPEWGFNGTTVNGNIYAIPTLTCFTTPLGVNVQKKLADEYGLDRDSIHNTRDLEPFMEWILENHPEIYPMNEGMQFASSLRGECDIVGTGFGYYLDFDDPYTVRAFWEHDGMMESYRMANEYFKKGYVRSDWPTVTDNSADDAAEKYAMWINGVSPIGKERMNYTEEYYIIQFGEPAVNARAGLNGAWAIPIQSTKAEAAMKVLSVLWTDAEAINMFYFGLEGVHYNKVGDNRIELIGDGEKYSKVRYSIGNEFLSYLTETQEDDTYIRYKEINDSAKVSPLLGFALDQSPIESELAQVAAVTSEYNIALLTADDFDAKLEEVKDALKAAGEDKIKEEISKQLEEFKASR